MEGKLTLTLKLLRQTEKNSKRSVIQRSKQGDVKAKTLATRLKEW